MAESSYPTPEVRGGIRKEIPLIQFKEQWLCFVGAAMKGHPKSMVRENPVSWYVLQEGIRGQTHCNHIHRKLVNLITRPTAMSNSVKLNHAVWGYPR